MIDLGIAATYLVLTTFFYLPTFWARYALSGLNFTPLKFWLVLVYGIFCSHYHFKFVKFSTLPFLSEVDNSVLRWISLIMPFLYGLSLPSPRERARWFRKRKFDPRIRDYK
jgi:hypothetical protein